MSIRLHPDLPTLRHLAAVASGAAPADLVLSGGALVNVYSEEVQEGWGVAVAAGRVAYVGPDAAQRAGSETELVDLAGDLVAPGLVEGHTHLTRLRISDFAELQVAAGITTTVVEASELAFVCGPPGVRELLAAAARLPGRLLFTIPPLANMDPGYDARIAPSEEWIRLLDEPGTVGVGELYWAQLLRGHARGEALIEAALERGMAVEGHGAGARPAVLNAMAAYGVGSDHEGIVADDLRARLRLGLYGLARHGATRQDLPAIAPVWRDGLDPGRLGLVTDGVEPEDALAWRNLNWVVQQAVEHGLALPRAVRLASRNVAEHLGLGRWLGGIAPGMLADLVVIPRDAFRPRLVLVAGRRPAAASPHTYPAWMRETVRPGAYDAGLLRHPGRGRWRAMELVAPLVTREVTTDGEGALSACVIDRTGEPRAFRGLLLGFGLRGGAAAISSGWECPGLTVVGDDAADMEAALRAVTEMSGGAAVVSGGRALATFAAPVAGLYSEATAEAVVERVGSVNRALGALGCPFPNPILTMETLTTPAIPHLRLWAGGYARLKDGACLGLDWP